MEISIGVKTIATERSGSTPETARTGGICSQGAREGGCGDISGWRITKRRHQGAGWGGGMLAKPT